MGVELERVMVASILRKRRDALARIAGESSSLSWVVGRVSSSSIIKDVVDKRFTALNTRRALERSELSPATSGGYPATAATCPSQPTQAAV